MEDPTPIVENSIESRHQHLVIDTLLAGAFAGFVRDTLLYPIEVYQFSRHLDVKFRLSMLFKGAMPVVIGAIPGAAAFISTYSLIKVHFSPYFSHERQYVVHMFSGLTAEAVSLLFKVPVDNVKKRHLTLRNHVSSYGITQRLRKSSGIAGFYRGFHPALFSRINTTLITLPLWEAFMEKVKTYREVTELKPSEICVCGAVAGGLAGGVTTPLHVARTYYVLQDFKAMDKELVEKKELKRIAKQLKEPPKSDALVTRMGKSARKSKERLNMFIAIIGEIYNKNGLRGLYRGCLARTVHVSLGGALFFYSYAFVMANLEDVKRPTAPCKDVDEKEEIQQRGCQTDQRELNKVLGEVRSRTESISEKPKDADTVPKDFLKESSQPTSETTTNHGNDGETELKGRALERVEYILLEWRRFVKEWFRGKPTKPLDEDVKDDRIVNINPKETGPSAKSIDSTGIKIKPEDTGSSVKSIGSTSKHSDPGTGVWDKRELEDEVKQEVANEGGLFKKWRLFGAPIKPSSEAPKHLENQTTPKGNENPPEEISKERTHSLEGRAHQEHNVGQPLNSAEKKGKVVSKNSAVVGGWFSKKEPESTSEEERKTPAEEHLKVDPKGK